MTNEELIIERLDRIENQIAPLTESIKGLRELKDDLMVVAHPASSMLIKHLEEVESSFQLEDLTELTKRFLRSVKNITYALTQLENIIDFVTTAEPLLKTMIPEFIKYLDDLEQKGVFRIIGATLNIRAKIAEAYTPEDIDQIGDGIVFLLGLAKSMTDSQTSALLKKAVEIPATVDLSTSKKIGPCGLISAGYNNEVKEGLGVLIELTKALGKLKENGGVSAPVDKQEGA